MTVGLFAGLAGLDITYYQNRFPQENLKSKTLDYQTFIGGPAANAAITYAILGGRSTLITCLGDTVIAKAIKSEFSQTYKVTVIDLAAGSELLPSLSSIFVNTKKATRTIWSGQQQFKILQERNLETLIYKASFCFSDCNLPEITVDFLHKSRELQKEIVLDPGSWKPHFPTCLSLADEVIASVNCRPKESDLFTFLKETAVKKLAITDGGNDTYWFQKPNQGVIRVPEVQAVDTLAAGDVLHGAYCYYRFHEGYSFIKALKKATIVASESVKYYGPRKGVYKVLKEAESKEI